MLVLAVAFLEDSRDLFVLNGALVAPVISVDDQRPYWDQLTGSDRFRACVKRSTYRNF